MESTRMSVHTACRIRPPAFALAAAALCTVGVASAADAPRPLSPTIAAAMKRDLQLDDGQLAQYFRTERTAFLRDAQLKRRLGA
jgi:hypothetical protein